MSFLSPHACSQEKKYQQYRFHLHMPAVKRRNINESDSQFCQPEQVQEFFAIIWTYLWCSNFFQIVQYLIEIPIELCRYRTTLDWDSYDSQIRAVHIHFTISNRGLRFKIQSCADSSYHTELRFIWFSHQSCAHSSRLMFKNLVQPVAELELDL